MTRHRDLEADLHPSIITARHLRATADTWPDLLAALARQGTPVAGGGKRTKRDAAPVPIDLHVSDVMGEIRAWATLWAGRLADETEWTPPGVGIDTPRTYRPPQTDNADDVDAPTLLRALALRTGHWTQHPDELVRKEFIEECETIRHKAETTAHPSGFRKIPVHRPCDVEGCTGELYAPLKPDAEYLPDLVCSQDRKHRVEPVEWSRPRWRREIA